MDRYLRKDRKSNRGKYVRKSNKGLYLFLIFSVVFSIELSRQIGSNKLYMEKKGWFNMEGYYEPFNQSCYSFTLPYITFDSSNKSIEIELKIEKKCDMYNNTISLFFKPYDLLDYTINSQNNLDFYNYSNGNKICLKVNGDFMEKDIEYWFTINMRLKKAVYNDYSFKSFKIPIGRFSFIWNKDYLWGYTCSVDCFNVITPLKNDYFEKGNSKIFDIRESVLSFEFRPKNNWAIFMIKLLDAVSAGLIVMLIYRIIEDYNKKIKK